MTELQSVVCSEWHTDKWCPENLSLFSLQLDTRKRQHDNGPGRADTFRPGPLKFVNFRPKPGPYGPGRAYGPPGPCRALFLTELKIKVAELSSSELRPTFTTSTKIRAGQVIDFWHSLQKSNTITIHVMVTFNCTVLCTVYGGYIDHEKPI